MASRMVAALLLALALLGCSKGDSSADKRFCADEASEDGRTADECHCMIDAMKHDGYSTDEYYSAENGSKAEEDVVLAYMRASDECT